jgi:hypothetical protein
MSPILNPTSRRTRRHLRPVLAAALVLSLAACEADGPVRPIQGTPAGIDGTGSTTVNAALIGTWQRTLVFVDEFGFSIAIETTWRFLEDGTFVRTITTSNLTLGLSDVIVTTGRWTIDGSSLVVQFDPPDSGEVIFEFFIVGNELTLAGEIYFRVSDGCC